MKYKPLHLTDLLNIGADVYLSELQRNTHEDMADHREAEAILKAVAAMIQENNSNLLPHLELAGVLTR